ncbi:MAG: hypothetical protein ACRDNG_11770 [Gaiellaceae bacterium]
MRTADGLELEIVAELATELGERRYAAFAAAFRSVSGHLKRFS